jgi:Uma2 family endonuclease
VEKPTLETGAIIDLRKPGAPTMAVSAVRPKLTYEDFERFPEDGLRHEILDGVHVVTPAPFTQHQVVSARLFRKLDSFVEGGGLGKVLYAPLDVVLSEHDIVEPDLLFVATDRLFIVQEKNVQGAPDLVIEILSKGTRRRDLGDKREIYERSGVREYWVLDPEGGAAVLHRRETEASPKFLPAVLLHAEEDDRLTSRLLPGLEISIRDILRA